MATEANHAPRVSPADPRRGATPGHASFRRAGTRLRRLWWLPIGAVLAVGLGLRLPVGASNLHVEKPSEGLICTNGNTATVPAVGTTAAYVSRSFVLTARDGYISTPDGNSIYMWSYANGDQDFQYPGPFLCANEGDHLTVTLRNTLKVPTSMVFTGISGVRADGAISQPDGGSTGPTTSLSKPAAPASSVTYTFVAAHPGTFLYESGTDPQLQVQMGMSGGLVVRPSTAALQCIAPVAAAACAYSYNPASASNYAYDTPFSRYNTADEYVHLLSEIDPDLHHWVEVGNTSYDWSKYNARYYMINGRSFPDTIAPNNISKLPSQPYGALVHVTPRSTVKTLPGGAANPDYNPDPALIRYLNAGPVAYPFHPHSNHESTVGTDGHELVTADGRDASVERFDLVVAPGQTIDSLFTWVDAQEWQPGSNPIGVPQPGQQDRFEGEFWSGSPYLGDRQQLSTGVTRFNECGEFYHVAHSHALFQVTNFGFSGGGMLTMVRVDPPPSLQQKNGTECTVPGK